MPNDRYQQGGVYRRGKHKNTWYGTFRIDTPEGRQPVNLRLGTTRELVTKAAARQKLHEMIAEIINPGAVTSTAKSMRYSDLVEKWKRSEGPAMSDNTLKHYSDALRAYVLATWKDYAIDSIQREDITNLLNSQAVKYSRSSLKSMRLVLVMTLTWAERNGYITRPTGWLEGIRLPRKTGGRKVVRTELEPSQTLGIIQRLKEPYSTLVLFLGLCGRRIEEAIGIKPADLDDNNVLRIRRVISNGRVEELAEEEQQVGELTYFVVLSDHYDGADFCNTLVYDAYRGEETGMLFAHEQAELLQTEDVATSKDTQWDNLEGFGRNFCAFIERVADEKRRKDIAAKKKREDAASASGSVEHA